MRREPRRPTVWWRLAALTTVTVAGLLAATGGAAAAQDGPVAADPAENAVLGDPPAEVSLDFGRAIDVEYSHIEVFDSTYEAMGADEAEAAGNTGLRVGASIAAPGDYTVAYHVVLADGSEVSGAYRFSVGTGAAPQPLGNQDWQTSVIAVQQHQHGVDEFSAVLLLIDGAVLCAVLALLWLRPRNGQRMSLRFDDQA
ncbi:copper resistance CopC family protein [Solwaraspora sp. WMMB335]|uniref:copper resistance CopC family protein n=1 Tax=Solwaraspora sp. WMMB335 TaxID=3404118 RepID=UPI003B94537A